jgi:hypothetical protein
VKPSAAHRGVGKKIEAAGKSRVTKEDTAMNRSHGLKGPRDISAALTVINIKVSRWRGLARRRFEAGEITDQAAFESLWPQILTNFFYAETARVSRALWWLSEDRNN